MQRIQSETVRNLELVLRDDNIMNVELEGTTVLQAFYQKEPRSEDISNFIMKFTATVNGPEREKKNKVYVHEFDVQDNEKEPAMKDWDKLRYLEEVKDARTKAFIYNKKNRDRGR